jgi:hypothetical protein
VGKYILGVVSGILLVVLLVVVIIGADGRSSMDTLRGFLSRL